MSIDLWEKGDKITSEKMNSIVGLLNKVEAAIDSLTTEVKSIKAKLNSVNDASKKASEDVNKAIEKYDAKLAEVTNAYDTLKAELTTHSNKNQRTSKNSNK